MSYTSIILLSLFACIPRCDGRHIESSPLSKSVNSFALKLLQKVHNKEVKNVFFSPYSLTTALAIVYNGARDETQKEMRQALGYDSAELEDSKVSEEFANAIQEINEKEEKEYELFCANRLVVNKKAKVLEPFEENAKNNFKASVDSLDFGEDPNAVMEDINQWVAKETNNKIDKLLTQPLDATTHLLILSAIYFKGIFQTKFERRLTREEDFFNGGITARKTRMMRRTGKFNYTEVKDLNSKLLEIPYTGDDISLYIVLPNKKQGLQELNEKLADMTHIEEATEQLQERDVSVQIPLFHMDFYYMLNKWLYDMGMKSLFVKRANLSGINGKKNLFVSKLIHKAYVDINEEGTEAAAATMARVQVKSMSPKRKKLEFKAEHPFMFFIRHNKNGLILFSGIIDKF